MFFQWAWYLYFTGSSLRWGVGVFLSRFPGLQPVNMTDKALPFAILEYLNSEIAGGDLTEDAVGILRSNYDRWNGYWLTNWITSCTIYPLCIISTQCSVLHGVAVLTSKIVWTFVFHLFGVLYHLMFPLDFPVDIGNIFSEVLCASLCGCDQIS